MWSLRWSPVLMSASGSLGCTSQATGGHWWPLGGREGLSLKAGDDFMSSLSEWGLQSPGRVMAALPARCLNPSVSVWLMKRAVPSACSPD